MRRWEMGKVVISADLKELIPRFMRNREREIKNIGEALEAGNFGKIATEAHKAKGAAGGYGFSMISEIAGMIEAAAIEKRGEAAAELFAKLKAELEACEIEYSEEEF
jgi:HPt (histidine-containing phosphotransfer) domain-containing protein